MAAINLELILIFLPLCFVLELLYFKLAKQFHIIDRPNERSSHTKVTIRGGGVIFSLTLLFGVYYYNFPYFLAGLILISAISFLDDINELKSGIRLTVQLIAALLMFYQLGLFAIEWYWLLVAMVFLLATLNAYNFMDGINGITGGYSTVAIGTLMYLNSSMNFTSQNFLLLTLLSLFAFNFFNFRKKARCFAGDVGSIAIAFIIAFVIGQLIVSTGNFSYIFLLLFYGMDAAVTVIFRVIRKENITKAHRSHFYQYLANQLKWPHLKVASLYMFLQLCFNIMAILFLNWEFVASLALVLAITIVFVVCRFKVEGKDYLMKSTSI